MSRTTSTIESTTRRSIMISVRVALVSASSYGTVDQHLFEDASAVYGPLLTGALHMPLGAGVDQHLSQRRFTQEVRLASTRNRISSGRSAASTLMRRNRLGQDLFAVNGATGARLRSLDGLIWSICRRATRNMPDFVNATWHIVPKFDITAGGRWSHNKQSEEQNTNGLLVGGGSVFSGSSSDSVFTYAVAPTFKPNATPVSTRGSRRDIAQGARTPFRRLHPMRFREPSGLTPPPTTKSA